MVDDFVKVSMVVKRLEDKFGPTIVIDHILFESIKRGIKENSAKNVVKQLVKGEYLFKINRKDMLLTKEGKKIRDKNPCTKCKHRRKLF